MYNHNFQNTLSSRVSIFTSKAGTSLFLDGVMNFVGFMSIDACGLILNY